MDRDDVFDRLESLVHLDVDAIHAYDEAIEKAEDQDVRSRLSGFRDDHQRHVTELTEAFRVMGGAPPTPDKDLRGVLIEGMTSLRSSMGTEQALKAMRQNETLTNNRYREAVEETGWDTEVLSILQRGYADEQRHLAWIEERLRVYDTVSSR